MIKFILFFTILFICTTNLIAQNYFPIQPGNKYYFGVYDYFVVANGGIVEDSTYSTIDSAFVNDSIVVSGVSYYNFRGNYYSYNSAENKLHSLDGMVKKLSIDFNLLSGGQTIFYNGSNRYLEYKGITDSLAGGYPVNIFNLGYQFNGFYNTKNSKIKFANGIGEVLWFHSTSDRLSNDNHRGETHIKQILYAVINGVEYNLITKPKIVSAVFQPNQHILLTINDEDFYWETGIVIERRIKGENLFTQIGILNNGTNKFYDVNFELGKIYEYRVKILTEKYSSVYSDTISIAVIEKPKNLINDPQVVGGVQLRWEYPSNLNAGFIIEKEQFSGSGFLPIDTVNSGVLTYLDSNVFTSSNPGYRVRAIYNDIISGYSNIVYTAPNILLSKPFNLNLIHTEYEAVKLSWSDTNIANVRFYVERSADIQPPQFLTVAQVDEGNTSYVDETVESLAQYQYRIRCQFGTISKEFGDIKTISAPAVNPIAAPTNFTAEVVNNTVRLNWNDNAQNEREYMIYRGDFITYTTFYASVPRNHTSYIDLYPLLTGGSAQKVYKLQAVNYHGNSTPVFVTATPSSIQNEIKPVSFSLSANYPNPFNPGTRISYGIPKNSFVHLKVYDILGNEIATLVDEEQSAGTYEVEFIAKNLTSGLYLYTLKAGEFTETKKMLLMK